MELVDRTGLFTETLKTLNSVVNVEEKALTSIGKFCEKYMVSRQESLRCDNMRNYMKFLHTIPGYEPSYFQRLLFTASAQVFAPAILTGASAAEQARAMREFDLEPIRTPYMFGESGRRMGKTDAATQIPAALLASVPHITILFFSLYMPTCQLACETTYRWLCLQGYKDRVQKTAFKIVFYGDDSDDIRTINFITGQSPDVNIYLYIFILIVFFSFLSGGRVLFFFVYVKRYHLSNY